jgi:hypothetical protein
VSDDYNPDLDFKSEADKLLIAMRFLAGLEIAAMRATIDYAHAIGPMLDPTAYRNALDRGDMQRFSDLLGALVPALKVWREKFADEIREAAEAAHHGL